MRLVEQHIIRPGHDHYTEIDRISFAAKNLYNAGLYTIRQAFFADEARYINYIQLQKQFQNTHQSDYEALPRKVSQQILRLLDKNFKSFFEAHKAYKKDPSRFLHRPRITRYKDPATGRSIALYTNQTFSKQGLKDGYLKLSGTSLVIPTRVPLKSIQQVRLAVKAACYVVEVVYTVPDTPAKEDNNRVAAIDPGINNLATLTTNTGQAPLIVNGRPLKSINQFYNKKRARLQAELTRLPGKTRHQSVRLERLTHKRNQKVRNYLHHASRFITNQLVSWGITTLVVGKNPLWKQDVNIGSKNNQGFVQIPHAQLIKQLSYKCQLEGINVIVQEESYTSKCSFLDNELIQKHEQYAGKRIRRGLFKSKDGTLINADVNGSANILRKAFPNAFTANGTEGIVVSPRRITPIREQRPLPSQRLTPPKRESVTHLSIS